MKSYIYIIRKLLKQHIIFNKTSKIKDYFFSFIAQPKHFPNKLKPKFHIFNSLSKYI